MENPEHIITPGWLRITKANFKGLSDLHPILTLANVALLFFRKCLTVLKVFTSYFSIAAPLVEHLIRVLLVRLLPLVDDFRYVLKCQFVWYAQVSYVCIFLANATFGGLTCMWSSIWTRPLPVSTGRWSKAARVLIKDPASFKIN